MPLPILPELSRSFKYQEYSNRPSRQSKCREENTVTQHNQTSSETSPSERCFEVRPSTNGVGMFAIKEISIGDIIIDSEEPIVSTSLPLFPATRTIITVDDDCKDRTKDTYVEKVNDRNRAPTVTKDRTKTTMLVSIRKHVMKDAC